MAYLYMEFLEHESNIPDSTSTLDLATVGNYPVNLGKSRHVSMHEFSTRAKEVIDGLRRLGISIKKIKGQQIGANTFMLQGHVWIILWETQIISYYWNRSNFIRRVRLKSKRWYCNILLRAYNEEEIVNKII